MNRFEKLMAAVRASELDGLLLMSEPNRAYASGFRSTDGAALITGSKAYYFTDSRYIEAAEKEISGAETAMVGNGKRYADLINEAASAHGVKKLGFEENSLTYGDYALFNEKLTPELCPAQKIVSALRASKDEEEQALMLEAQRIAEKSFMEVLPLISTEITETDLAAELLYRMLKNGAEDKSFDTIAASGEKSSMPHGVPESRKIRRGFLTIDFGARYKGYCSDTTRTLCLGEPTREMRLVYDTVLRAQEAGIAAARAGVSGREVDKAARDIIEGAGYGAFFGHAFGHSLGLEIHEAPNASPSSPEPLPAGAAVSAEPGIYLPGKFGVRIEDVLFITPEGSTDITNLTKELIVL